MNHVSGVLKALLWPAVAATIGGTATNSSVNSWYPKLEKPSFNPPGWVFGPTWTTLYIMMGVADYLVSQRGDGAAVDNARSIYRIQLALNATWSVLFFGLRAPLFALVEIGFLWAAIVVTMVRFARISKLATALLVPYLLWTTFASVLNAAIWYKNR